MRSCPGRFSASPCDEPEILRSGKAPICPTGADAGHILRGVPGHIRSDNGPEFAAKAVQQWITAVGARTAYIAARSPQENGYVESFKVHSLRERADWRIRQSVRLVP